MAVTRETMPYPLGWQPAPPDPRTMRLAPYKTAELPPPPPACDWLKRVPDWPMLLNDRVGDCEPAACAHIEMAWAAASGRTDIRISDADVLAAYEAIGGFDPAQVDRSGSNPTDRGCTSLGTLNHWRKVGMGGRRIEAYVQINHLDHDEVRTAIHLFGAILVAAELPLFAGVQFRNHKVWRPTIGPTGVRGSWGGHAIHVGAYHRYGLLAVTWGTVQGLTWSWWNKYVAEAYCMVSTDWLNRAGESPAGINLAGLLTDLRQLVS